MAAAQIPWGMAITVFIGTLPIFGVTVWILIEVRGLRQEVIDIRKELTSIRERLATLEERLNASRRETLRG
jgi:hypothetical protein